MGGAASTLQSKRQGDITVLREYGVPLLNEQKSPPVRAHDAGNPESSVAFLSSANPEAGAGGFPRHRIHHIPVDPADRGGWGRARH
jgi:hypothetical protein